MKRELGGEAFVDFVQQNMGAEDFTYFVTEGLGVPGYYFAVGGTTPERIAAAKAGGPPIAGHHSPLFQIAPRESVITGTRAMVAAVLDLAGPKTKR
jgi:hippurate hydrolase